MKRRAAILVFFAALVLLAVELLVAQSGIPPVIVSLTPPNTIASSTTMTLNVLGANFVSGATINWNGSPQSTTYVGPNELTTSISSSLLTSPGAADITVTQSGFISNSSRFQILTPLATVTSYTPQFFTPGVSSAITVNGQGFNSNATIFFDWFPITTTYVSSTVLYGSVGGSAIVGPGPHHVAVYNALLPQGVNSLSLQSQLNFAPETTSTVGQESFVVTNASTTSVTLSTPFYQFSGVNAADFTNTGTGSCTNGLVLAANATCTLTLSFKPSIVGAEVASVQVISNGVGSPQYVTLVGTGTPALAPAVSLNPTVLSFGTQQEGIASQAITSTLTNSGTANLTLSSISVGGTNQADFVLSGSCSNSLVLVPGQTCNLTVQFTPSTNSTESAIVSVTDNAVGSPHQLPLTGSGQPAPISVSVSPTSFSVQTSQTQKVVATTSNAGTVNWTLSGSGCSGSTCGTLSSSSSSSGAAITYTAPSSVPSPATVTLTATSTTDSTKSASSTITVTSAPAAISVSLNTTSASVQVSKTQSFTALVSNDTTSSGVTWVLSGLGCSGSACGSLSSSSSASGTAITYTAPSSVPSPASVTLTATSVHDTTKSAIATITVTAATPIAVSLNQTAVSVQTSQTSSFTATVNNDASASGVTWLLKEGGVSCSPSCGTISASSSSSGTPITYTAPSTVPGSSPFTRVQHGSTTASMAGGLAVTVNNGGQPYDIGAHATSSLVLNGFTTVGNYLVLCGTMTGGGEAINSIASSNGTDRWSQAGLASHSTDQLQAYCWSAPSTAGVTSLTVSITNPALFFGAFLYDLTLSSSSVSIQTTTANNQPATTTPTGPAITPTGSGIIITAEISNTGQPTSIAAPFTMSSSGAVAQYVNSTTATQTPSWSGASDAWAGVTISITAAGGGSGGTVSVPITSSQGGATDEICGIASWKTPSTGTLTLTDNKSQSYTNVVSGPDYAMQCTYGSKAGVTSLLFSVSSNPASVDLYYLEYTGITNGTPDQIVSNNSIASGTTFDSGFFASSTVNPIDVLIGFAKDSAATSFTAGNDGRGDSYTKLESQFSNGSAIQDFFPTSAVNTYKSIMTANNAGTGEAFAVALPGGLSGAVTLTATSVADTTKTATATITVTPVQNTPHSVTLSWVASTSSNLVGYNVYRSTTNGGPYTLLTPTPITIPSPLTITNGARVEATTSPTNVLSAPGGSSVGTQTPGIQGTVIGGGPGQGLNIRAASSGTSSLQTITTPAFASVPIGDLLCGVEIWQDTAGVLTVSDNGSNTYATPTDGTHAIGDLYAGNEIAGQCTLVTTSPTTMTFAVAGSVATLHDWYVIDISGTNGQVNGYVDQIVSNHNSSVTAMTTGFFASSTTNVSDLLLGVFTNGSVPTFTAGNDGRGDNYTLVASQNGVGSAVEQFFPTTATNTYEANITASVAGGGPAFLIAIKGNGATSGTNYWDVNFDSGADGYVLASSLQAITTMYTDNNVTHGTTYYYVVTAVGTNPPYSPTESVVSNQTVVTP